MFDYPKLGEKGNKFGVTTVNCRNGFLRFQLNNVLITNCIVSVQIGAASTMTNF